MRGLIGQMDDATQRNWSRFKIAVTAEDAQTLFMLIRARGTARWSYTIAASAPEGARPTSNEYAFFFEDAEDLSIVRDFELNRRR